MKHIVTVVGARPQFIKASPVSRALQNAGIEESIIHTGQHSDQNMSDVFFEEMSIPKPKSFLGISGLTHGAMTGEMLKRIEEELVVMKPDAVLVYGDTNSTIAGALAATKLHIPVAHVEAGLRSFNMRMPEEINRVVTDRISRWLFCPTSTAIRNLEQEGYRAPTFSIQNVGDVMLDATLLYRNKARWPSGLSNSLKNEKFVLCTLHRQESTEDALVFSELLDALKEISKEVPVVWPVHPRARKTMEARGLNPNGIHMIPPVGYLEMLALLEACSLVATDSGGLQKESYFFRKPCLTLRSETEWTELVEAGVNKICGHDKASIVREFRTSVDVKFPADSNLYGLGHSSEQIAESLIRSSP